VVVFYDLCLYAYAVDKYGLTIMDAEKIPQLDLTDYILEYITY
jgi:hypothetical protein